MDPRSWLLTETGDEGTILRDGFYPTYSWSSIPSGNLKVIGLRDVVSVNHVWSHHNREPRT